MLRSYRARALRNSIFILLSIALAWYSFSCPLPTEALELHRAEQQYMAERSTIIFTYQSEYPHSRNKSALVGVTPKAVHIYFNHELTVVPRKRDTATLISIPETVQYYDSTVLESYPVNLPHLLAIDPPAGAVSAQLTIDLKNLVGWHEGYEPYTTEATREGDTFPFRLERKYCQPDDHSQLSADEAAVFYSLWQRHNFDLEDCPYTLEFFDTQGNLIETVTN